MNDLIYGINSVREALRGDRRRPIELFVIEEGGARRIAEVEEEARKMGVPVRKRERKDLDRLAGNHHHQGVVLRLEPFPYVELEDLVGRWRASESRGFFLVVDGVTDPHNFGALIRSADAAGCHGVIAPKDRSCSVTSVVDRASAGALSHLPLCQVTNLARALDHLKSQGVWVYGLAGGESIDSIYEADLSVDLALVVGSEGEGIRPNVMKRCDLLLSIPMRGGVSSLNASVAAGVALFEALRQRSA